MSLQDFDEMPRFIQVVKRFTSIKGTPVWRVQFYNYAEDGQHRPWGFTFDNSDLRKALREANKFKPANGRVLYTELRLM